ncbi:MAG TPA: EscU/YscU/HrcU family type III secretion system export apparatus switch protein, partial [Polyangiaceae bacterium]|nr:EscU/YscU/HrcU family type III secretion system export apparatus switch protein [Polyangiaceae bacterium]
MPDKTEQPTARRLRKAREAGDSGASAYASQAVSFLVAVALVPPTLAALASRAAGGLRSAIAQAASGAPPRIDPAELGSTVAALVLPPLLAVAVAGAAAQAVQTGGVVAAGRLSPKLERLDPIAGLRGVFSAARLFAVVRSIAAASLVSWFAWAAITEHLPELAAVAGRPRWVPALVARVAAGLAWRAAAVGLALGALDVLVTRRVWMRRLRMSKEEVRREQRESEGDPQIKAARERAYHEMMAQANVAQVRGASVVVVNPTHLACALRYDASRGDEAPIVVAHGEAD